MDGIRRAKLEIFYDILDAINNQGINVFKPTQIQLKVNMSYDKLMKNISELEEKKLIQPKTFQITDNGLKFLQDYKEVKSVVGELRGKYLGITKPEETKQFDEKILIVDDDNVLLEMMSETISQFGYKVYEAQNAKDAITQYEKNSPNLVLMDINLPDKSGYQSFFEIQEKFPDAKVIFMTGYQDLSKWQKAKVKGAVYLVKKPLSAGFLKELIVRHIKEPEI